VVEDTKTSSRENAVVGRVAPRAQSSGLKKDWLSLKIGRRGTRGATRPAIHEVVSSGDRFGPGILLADWRESDLEFCSRVHVFMQVGKSFN